MREAGNAIDRLGAEVAALKRIIVAERAQVIYYTEKALAFSQGKALELTLSNFADQAEDVQQKYVEQAIRELGSDESVVPHAAPGVKPGEEKKKLIV